MWSKLIGVTYYIPPPIPIPFTICPRRNFPLPLPSRPCSLYPQQNPSIVLVLVRKQDHCIQSGVKIISLLMRNPSSTTTGSKITVPTPCCSKVGIKKGPWTPEEDELLANYIKKEGEGRWRTLPKRAGLLRCGKSCRLRWMNYLRPCVKRGHIAPDEEDLILRLHRLLGNRWSLIAGRIPGRTDNEIKNYWNTSLSKKLISQGIDPRTHRPLKPNPDSSEMESVPVQNCNPKSPPPVLEENGRVYRTVATRVSENFTAPPNLDDQFPSQVAADATEYFPNRDGFNMGSLQSGYDQGKNDDDLIGDIGNEDSLSSFLDSLLNDNVFVYQQRQQLQQQNMFGLSSKLVVSSSQILSPGNIWEAQVSPPMAAFGDKAVGGAPSNSLPVLTHQPAPLHVLKENQTDVINGMY